MVADSTIVVDSTIAMVVSAAVDFMIAIATSGVAASASASTRMTTTTMNTMTTAVAMWSNDACTPGMAGACNPVRCAVDRLTIVCRPQRSLALRSLGDLGGLVMPSRH